MLQPILVMHLESFDTTTSELGRKECCTSESPRLSLPGSPRLGEGGGGRQVYKYERR